MEPEKKKDQITIEFRDKNQLENFPKNDIYLWD